MKNIIAVVILCGACFASPDSGKIENLAQAIARAEGFNQRGSIPNRYRNPGDLKAVRGWRYPGQVGVGKANHVIFGSYGAGWSALRHQLEKIVDGSSTRYNVNMTVEQMGRKYAGRWSLWSKNVSKNLNVDKDTELWEILDIPPVIQAKMRPMEVL